MYNITVITMMGESKRAQCYWIWRIRQSMDLSIIHMYELKRLSKTSIEQNDNILYMYV